MSGAGRDRVLGPGGDSFTKDTVWAGSRIGGKGFHGLSLILSFSSIWSYLSKSVLIVKSKNISVTCGLDRNLMNRHSEPMPNHKQCPVLRYGQVVDMNFLPTLQMISFAFRSLGFLHAFIPQPLCFSLQRFLRYFPFNNRAIALSSLATLLLLNWRSGLLKLDILFVCCVQVRFIFYFIFMEHFTDLCIILVQGPC